MKPRPGRRPLFLPLWSDAPSAIMSAARPAGGRRRCRRPKRGQLPGQKRGQPGQFDTGRASVRDTGRMRHEGETARNPNHSCSLPQKVKFKRYTPCNLQFTAINPVTALAAEFQQANGLQKRQGSKSARDHCQTHGLSLKLACEVNGKRFVLYGLR